jgi:hypothetical protein
MFYIDNKFLVFFYFNSSKYSSVLFNLISWFIAEMFVIMINSSIFGRFVDSIYLLYFITFSF